MNASGVPGDYGGDMSRLLSNIWREIAKGKPVTQKRVASIVKRLGVSAAESDQLLRKMAERDDDDNIIGILGLSQDDRWAHRLTVNGIELRTWCAWDQFFIAQVLGQTIKGESESPLSKQTVNITISPSGVESCSPAGTVVSIVTLDPDKYDKRKLEELWSGL
jgi:hypothetical protein